MVQWSFFNRSTIRIVRGKAVTARLLIGSDVPIIGRNERAEGLEIVLVFCTRALARNQSKTPSGDIWSALTVSAGFLGWQRCG